MMRSWPLWLLTSSACAAAPSSERSFGAPPETVRAAVRSALASHEGVREEGDLIRCGWGPERASGEQGFFLGHEYVYRARYEARVSGSWVEVRAAVERRAAGGPRSRNWERVDGAPAARALLAEVGRRLEKTP